ncbi:uncharacterized protein LOC131675629 [Phymastichus coffea]|uniref:uncharacterized protein LOC131675629 n=1 Tax=Phymastichus coffea TaxID=108790 RepID=UPI00273C43D7|nr:uncharacterized protein LOC131675629 [Phymastichus coffea]
MNILCKHCQAKHFKNEKVSNKESSFNDCCDHGTVKLDPFPDFPLELLTLFNGEYDKSSSFFDDIRNYNSSLSFASFNVNLVHFQMRRSAPYCFIIQEQIYYQINTALYASGDKNPSYGQLFIIDQNEAIDYRMQQNPLIDYELMSILDNIIRNHNSYAKSYEMMKDEIRIQQLLKEMKNDSSPTELQLLFSLKLGQDSRRYNFQRVNEVAAIFSTTVDGEIPESYITIRNKNTQNLEIVNSLDPNVEPWIYPLFYSYGTRGWHTTMYHSNSNRKITLLDYTKYKISVRESEFNPIIRDRRLFQQWIVDSYVKIERDRIQYCKSHKKELRVDTYKGLHDHMSNSTNDINGTIGKTVILPSSFTGSPWYMQQCYQDAMAIFNETGQPDIFLTMTCNPNWPEITENLLPSQQAADRPDLVAKVFDLKKDHLLDIVKRGLPHMHLLITLEQGYKITTADIVDEFILAEIPENLSDSRLYNIVMKNMIHGPCGDWCLRDGKCSKNFPKDFNQYATLES